MANLKILSGLLLFLCVAYASSCASNSYSQSCSQCAFDSNGKMNQTCYKGFQDSGISCLMTSHPIAAAKYADGKCTAINECTTELNSCKAQYASGSDKEDCKEGSLAICFAAADQCIDQAAAKCGDQVPGCSAPAAFVGVLALLGFAKLTKRA